MRRCSFVEGVEIDLDGPSFTVWNRRDAQRAAKDVGIGEHPRRLRCRQGVDAELGASVPFRFDVHTIYFSEDAVTLETELHRHFASRALNQANSRKEFFFATPSEVRDVLASKVGNILEFNEVAEATEYFQSVGRWPSRSN